MKKNEKRRKMKIIKMKNHKKEEKYPIN